MLFPKLTPTTPFPSRPFFFLLYVFEYILQYSFESCQIFQPPSRRNHRSPFQRLSLDSSSASKLYSYGGGRKDDTYDIDDLKPVSTSPSSSSSAADYDDHELKDFKPRRLSLQSPFATTHQKQEKLVHFIPILTLICFIILYLSSHAPSQSDLAQFNGFMRSSSKLLESDENGDMSGLIRADTLSIRTSIRNLQETESFAAKSLPRRRTSHRKTADF